MYIYLHTHTIYSEFPSELQVSRKLDFSKMVTGKMLWCSTLSGEAIIYITVYAPPSLRVGVYVAEIKLRLSGL